MKLLKTHYATIFLASLYAANCQSAEFDKYKVIYAASASQVLKTAQERYKESKSTNPWPYAQELDQLITSGSLEKLKTFFDKHPKLISVSISDEYPLPPLSHYLSYCSVCTSEQDLCDTVQMLINFGAGVNTLPNCAPKKSNWRLPIMLATEHHRSVRLLEILFSHGATCNAQDENGTILQHLIRRMTVMLDKHFLPLIEKAVQYGADPYLKSTSPFFENTQKVDCFDIIKKNKEDFSRNITAYNNHDPNCILDRYDYENAHCVLKYLEQTEKLLKTKYIAPIKIIKTDKNIHLTYKLNQ